MDHGACWSGVHKDCSSWPRSLRQRQKQQQSGRGSISGAWKDRCLWRQQIRKPQSPCVKEWPGHHRAQNCVCMWRTGRKSSEETEGPVPNHAGRTTEQRAKSLCVSQTSSCPLSPCTLVSSSIKGCSRTLVIFISWISAPKNLKIPASGGLAEAWENI